MTEKDHYKYGLSGDKVDVEVAERLRARIRALEAALRESGEQLRMGAYHVGELGMAWTATIVTPECQKIQRTLKVAHLASVTALETGVLSSCMCRDAFGRHLPACPQANRGTVKP